MTQLNKSGITRRGLLRGATAMGAAALILPAGMRAASAAPKKGGVLRIGMGHGSTSDSLDPGTWDNAYSQVFASARHNYLTEIDADGQLMPELATEWSSPDATTWTFKIREGVTFHSGKTLDAGDVIASLNHHRGEDSESAAKPIVSSIVDMKADGSHTVVITLEAGNADFPFIISDYHLAILPAKDGKIDPMTLDGCGGYVVDSFEPGVQATLSRNPNYWKSDRAHFDGLEILPIVDAAARQNALLSGQVDVIDRVDLSTVHLLERAPNVNILSVSGTQHYVLPMDSRAAPYSDNNVRLALKHAINREELVDKILNGYGSKLETTTRSVCSNRYFAKRLSWSSIATIRTRRSSTSRRLASSVSGRGTVERSPTPLSAVQWTRRFSISEKAAAAGINIDRGARAGNDGYWSRRLDGEALCRPVYWGGQAH